MAGNKWTRREVLRAGGAAFALPYLIPSGVMGGNGRIGPNDKVNVAVIGLGGRARGVATTCLGVPDMRIVAVCDCFGPLCDAFIAGAGELGIPQNPDYNGAVQEGISYVQRTAHKGRRVSTATAFLNPAKSRGNLTVKTRAQATRILLEDKRATGVEVATGGGTGPRHELHARREVIVSGGAINSPQLLQLSGIGDPEHLAAIGVPLRHVLPRCRIQNPQPPAPDRFQRSVCGQPAGFLRDRVWA